MAHHDLIIHPLILRCVRVTGVTDVTPRMRRITLAGEQLGAFTRDGLDLPAFTSPGFDDHVKLIFASDGDVASVLPEQLPNGIEWAPSETREGRDYTPRRFDPVAGELDLDFVTHGDGPAASWAASASPGDELWFAGPKSSTVVPADPEWVLLAGDETALPAISRFFEERPTDAPVRAVITIADESARQELRLGTEDLVEWVLADETDELALSRAVERIELPEGTPYVWGAAESRALLPLRRFARGLGAPKSHVNITGYWHQRADPEVLGDQEASPELPEPPVLWFALRAALRLGLIDALLDGPSSCAALAERLGTREAELDPLIELLVQNDILARAEGGAVALGRLGEELAEDEHEREEYEGFDADRVLALSALPEALAAGASAWEQQHAATLRGSAEAEPACYAELAEEAAGLPHVLTGLAGSTVWGRGKRIAITGPGAIEVGDVLSADTGAIITVHEAAGPLAVLRAAADPRDWEFATEVPQGTDLVVTALALGHRTDEEALELLRALAGAAQSAVLVERLSPDGLSPAASAAAALIDFAVLGVPTRTPERILQLAEEAGWTVAARVKLGWGIESVELTAAAGRA